MAAGVDEVALDAFGATLLGLKPEAVGFIGEAERSQLGRSDYQEPQAGRGRRLGGRLGAPGRNRRRV